jgi:S-adenosylmethionine-dependent methyltransferase
LQISFHVADASKLLTTLPSLTPQLGTFDAVLLLGPLYHLLDEHDRLSTLDQCGDLLKEGGICYAAFVSTFGHLRGMVGKDPRRLRREKDFYESYLGPGEGTGKYIRREGVVSYHIHPSQIVGVFEKVKELKMERLIGCEGFLGAESAARLNDSEEEDWKVWLNLMMRYAEDQCVIGSSEHLLAISRKVRRS